MFDRLVLHETSGTKPALKSSTKIACGLASFALSGGLIAALLLSERAGPGLAALTASRMDESGVENPVTAVLLNFRSYDTLLEIAVLLIVAVAMLSMQPSATNRSMVEVNHRHSGDPVLAGLLRWLVALATVLSGYLLWTGAYAPGGAFQAGSVIAGACVALKLSGRYHFFWHPLKARLLLTIGLAVFVLVGGFCATGDKRVLEYPLEYAGMLILIIELAATVSIAAILLLLFTGLQDDKPDATQAGRPST